MGWFRDVKQCSRGSGPHLHKDGVQWSGIYHDVGVSGGAGTKAAAPAGPERPNNQDA